MGTWISIKERLPQVGVAVWVNVRTGGASNAGTEAVLMKTAAGGHKFQAHSDHVSGHECELAAWYENRAEGGFGLVSDRITHWMPLPEPPTE